MSDVSATEAARRFSDLLDAVEHDGASFTIVRHGKAVAYIEPISRGRGQDAKSLLRRHQPDPAWAEELDEVRTLVELDHRS